MLSLNYKFIFFEHPKTASTSICKELTDSIKSEEELLTFNNYNNTPEAKLLPLCDLVINRHKNHFEKTNGMLWRDGHLNPIAYRNFMHNENYVKFAVRRNPWDKFLSAYLHNLLAEQKNSKCQREIILSRKLSKFKSFNDFCSHFKNGNAIDPYFTGGHFHPQVNFYEGFQDKIIFIKYENLKSDLENFVRKKLNLNFELNAHMNNSRKSLDKKLYTDYYNQESIDIVSNIYKEDIKYFGYKFEQ
jgi:hypothetical protein